MSHDIIFALYPTITTIRNLDAYDADGNQVAIDMALVQAEYDAKQYQRDRAKEYPPMADYLDAVVKGDQAQVDAYIAACLAVKAKYPKPE
jgi:hypothetical protein